jgi:hypothetical protein
MAIEQYRQIIQQLILEPTFRTLNCHTPKKRIYLVYKN